MTELVRISRRISVFEALCKAVLGVKAWMRNHSVLQLVAPMDASECSGYFLISAPERALLMSTYLLTPTGLYRRMNRSLTPL